MSNLDQKAWETIDSVTASLVDFSGEGINYGEISRWFLWDKVGRYYRKTFCPDDFAFEVECLRRFEKHQSHAIWRVKLRLLANLIKNRCQKKIRTEYKRPPVREGGKLVFVPFPDERIRGIAEIVINERHTLATNIQSILPEFVDATVVTGDCEKAISSHLSTQIHTVLNQRLKALGVILEPDDRGKLYRQIVQQQRLLAQADAEISAIQPDLIFLHGDNHSPYQEYAAVATKYGVPTMTFQHGLDCERYYLDHAYSSHYGVWSQTRCDQYRAVNPARPKCLQVTGNPKYDALSYPESINTEGDFWLWITRPHKPKYCYAPTRRPSEGVEIFRALISALGKNPTEKLLVKPHPNDFAEIYRELAVKSDCANRIVITDEKLDRLIPLAKLIISEDSSAGVETMFSGKLVIHTHFAESAPVLKLTDFGAALPGFSPAQLSDSIDQASRLSLRDRQRMLIGQCECLDYYAGPLDGLSSHRQKKFILDTLNGL